MLGGHFFTFPKSDLLLRESELALIIFDITWFPLQLTSEWVVLFRQKHVPKAPIFSY